MCVNVVIKRYERKCHIYWKVDLGQRSMLKLPREPSKMESSAQNLVATDMGHVEPIALVSKPNLTIYDSGAK